MTRKPTLKSTVLAIVATGPLAGIDLDGASVSVGSKNFTEQILLGKMATILL